MDEKSDKKHSSKKLLFIVIVVLLISIIGIVFILRRKEEKSVNLPASPYTVTPSVIATAAGATQSFSVVYPVPGGWQNISDASIYMAGGRHDQWIRYNPVTKSFNLLGAANGCTAGQATTLSNDYLTLNCSTSSASGPGESPMVTFSLTPKRSLSGIKFIMSTIVIDNDQKGNGGIGGNWTVK